MIKGALKNFRLQYHPDYTVGRGISPLRALSDFAGCTAGGELHSAPCFVTNKILLSKNYVKRFRM